VGRDHFDRGRGVRGSGGGDRLRRGRAWPQAEEDHDDDRDEEEEQDDAGGDASGALLRLLEHEVRVPAGARQDKPGILEWVAAHRLWLVPLLCVVFVVMVEVGASLAGRTLTLEAHAALGAFFTWSTGREWVRRHAEEEIRSDRRRLVRQIAREHLLPEALVRRELELVSMIVERRAIEEGRTR